MRLLRVSQTYSRPILYINGMPLVVFEFKSAIREKLPCHEAYVQLTNRYKRDIPELFKYNAFCVISDGVNNKAGAFFSKYEFFYAWRKNHRQRARSRWHFIYYVNQRHVCKRIGSETSSVTLSTFRILLRRMRKLFVAILSTMLHRKLLENINIPSKTAWRR